MTIDVSNSIPNAARCAEAVVSTFGVGFHAKGVQPQAMREQALCDGICIAMRDAVNDCQSVLASRTKYKARRADLLTCEQCLLRSGQGQKEFLRLRHLDKAMVFVERHSAFVFRIYENGERRRRRLNAAMNRVC